MYFVHRLIYHEPPFICEGANFGTGLSTIVENDETAEPTDWLHRNDNYVPGRRGPRMVLSRPLPTSGEAGQAHQPLAKIKPSSYIFYCAYIYYISMQNFICISCVATM